MTMPSTTRRIAVLLCLVPGIWSADALADDGSFEQRLSVGDTLTLDVQSGSGSIEVRTGSAGEAVVRGEIRVNRRFLVGRPSDWEEIVAEIENNPPIELQGNRLEVGHFRDRSLNRKVSLSYEITVPESTEVIAASGSGSVSVVGVAAPVEVQTGSGRIEVEDIGGPVSAKAGSGSILADGVGGEFRGSAGSGRITMTQTAPGDVEVSTGSGSTELKGVNGAVRASAGSGSITVEGRMTGDWTFDTGSGTVRVTLPEDAAFDFDAESGSGGIEIDHPLTLSGRVSNKHLRGTVRGGGPELRVETGSGAIRIR